MINRAELLIVKYDQIGDVLYFALGERLPGRMIEGEEGVLTRVSGAGDVIGVTVEDYEYCWSEKSEKLAAIAGRLLQIDPNTVLLHMPASAH